MSEDARLADECIPQGSDDRIMVEWSEDEEDPCGLLRGTKKTKSVRRGYKVLQATLASKGQDNSSIKRTEAKGSDSIPIEASNPFFSRMT